MIQTKKERIAAWLCIVVFFAALVASLVRFKAQNVSRRLFYFPSYDSKNLCTEVRYVPNNPVQGAERFFVEELLLGPMTNRYKRIFPRDAALDYCFLKGDVLYVGLNDAVLSAVEGMSIKESIAIMNISIVKNFTYINKIDVSIGGKSVYD